MSTLTAPDPAAPGAGATTGRRPRGGRGWRGRRVWPWLLALAAAWSAPLITHRLGLDWLLPLAVLGVLAGLQHGARTVLDRLVLALVQVFGALCVAGLLLSVWPWHLDPVPIAGAALTTLVVVAFLTRRRWWLPRRLPPADRLVGVATLGVVALSLPPFALRDLGGRLGILMPGEDFARHFLLTDLIGRVGGYAFVHPQAADPFLPDSIAAGIRNYPQGVHLGYAVLDRFVRSSPATADGITGIDIMIWLYVATFGFLAVAVLWSLRRIAGPGADPVRLLPVLTVAAVWVYFGEPMAIFVRGYPNELVGLALAAVLTAVVARPLTARGDQLATVALLLVGVSFSYHLFLPYAGVLVAAWAWRERLWRRPAALLAAALVAPAAALTPVLNAPAASARQLTTAGTAVATDRPAVLALVALAVAGLTLRRGWRSPARRMGALALAAALGLVGGLGVLQLVTVGRTVYYFEKTLHLTVVVALVLLGGLVRLVPRGRSAWRGAIGHARRILPGLALALPMVVVLVALGGPGHTRPGSPGLRLATGVDNGSPAGGRDALLITRRFPDAGGAVNVDLMSTPYRNWLATYYGSVLQRNYRYGHDWYIFLSPHGPPKTLADLETMVSTSPAPVRLFVFNPRASMLVIDPANPNRDWTRTGADAAAFGDPAALTNIQAAEYLAGRYPGRVEVLYTRPPDP